MRRDENDDDSPNHRGPSRRNKRNRGRNRTPIDPETLAKQQAEAKAKQEARYKAWIEAKQKFEEDRIKSIQELASFNEIHPAFSDIFNIESTPFFYSERYSFDNFHHDEFTSAFTKFSEVVRKTKAHCKNFYQEAALSNFEKRCHLSFETFEYDVLNQQKQLIFVNPSLTPHGAMGYVTQIQIIDPEKGKKQFYALKRFYFEARDFSARRIREIKNCMQLGPETHRGLCAFVGFLQNDPKFITFFDESSKPEGYPDKPGTSLLFSWCNGGSVQDHLLKSTSQSRKLFNSPYERFVRWAEDGFSGLNTLYQKKFIHADIASRNVMFHTEDEQVKFKFNVNDDGSVRLKTQVTEGEVSLKIIDIGDSYYFGNDLDDLLVHQYSPKPSIAIYAPETLDKNHCSGKTDVCSLAFVLAEIILGVPHEYVMSNRSGVYRALELLLDNLKIALKQLGDPQLSLFKLLSACLDENPEIRPTAQQALEKLRVIREYLDKEKQERDLMDENVEFEIEESCPLKSNSKESSSQSNSKDSACCIL